jgi:glucan phosphoethanolaminetransferase (alkaline phosphatase superfamily)
MKIAPFQKYLTMKKIITLFLATVLFFLILLRENVRAASYCLHCASWTVDDASCTLFACTGPFYVASSGTGRRSFSSHAACIADLTCPY